MPGEEEAKAMQEKLKNMSPEELKQFQMQNCVFCQIIEGKVASKKVYEDDKCLAILDINPANPGHVLLMPKEHYSIMPLIPEDIINHLFMISKQISTALLKALKAEGTNIFVANGAAAGQKAQHFMIHIIPRMEKDGVGLDIKGQKADENTLEQIKKVIMPKINKAFNIKEEIEVKPNAVEAKFREISEKQSFSDDAQKPKVSDKPKKKETKKETMKKKKSVKKPKKKITSKKKKQEKANLDDIANLVTGRL